MKSLNKLVAFLIGFAFLINPISCVTTSSNLTVETVSPRESFVKLSFELDGTEIGGGSGVIVRHSKENSFILTAGHVCEPLDNESYALDLAENKYHVQVVHISDTSDLCLLKSVVPINRPASPIAKEMIKPGEKAINASAPFGIHNKNLVLQFEGYYSGSHTHSDLGWELDTYTIPTRPGSSGSPIFNQNLEIIGITSMALLIMENIGMSATLKQIKQFLKESRDIQIIHNQ